MPYVTEHLKAGFYASMGAVAISIARFYYGYVATQYDVLRLSILAVIFIIIGSDLPDIDGKQPPTTTVSTPEFIVVPQHMGQGSKLPYVMQPEW